MNQALSLLALLTLNGPNDANSELAAVRTEPVLTAQDELNAALASIAVPRRSAKDELLKAVQDGRVWLKLRYRFENVSQNGVMKEAYASTLRTVLGFETASWHEFSGTLEFEDVSPILDDSFNSTANGKGNRPVVADPDVSEVNQAFIQYKHGDAGRARIGRQRITLGNHRWVGNVGWRQNEQTYNGVSAAWDFGGGSSAFYSFVRNVQDVKGGDWRMHTHLLNFTQEVEDVGEVTLYGYRLNFDQTTGNEPSTNTVGARVSGENQVGDLGSVAWFGEFAHQEDAAQNNDNVNASYFAAGGSWGEKCGTFGIGYEMLSGNGMNGHALQTPLATLHKFNGWADKFLTNPDEGLVDTYWSYGTNVGPTKVKAIYHDFDADHGNANFGSELDLDAVWPVCENLTVGARYANYMAKDNAGGINLDSTRKFWFWMSFWT